MSGVLAFVVRVLLGPTVRFDVTMSDATSRIFYANHSSHLDFVVIWSSLPASQRAVTHPVAARDYWSRGAVRRFIAGRLFGALMIERSKPTPGDNPVQQMIDVLDTGDSLILFPEGTRGTGEGIAAFRSGIFQIHQARPQVELVPVYLENLNRVLPKGEFVPVPVISHVVFGAPLSAVDNEGRSEFLERARQALIKLGDD